jgi:hypothetical protein
VARRLAASARPRAAAAAPGPPVAIGGIGGSGTRVAAELLAALGLQLGGDLNEASDNLWFTLLFKEPGVLGLADAELQARWALFRARMSAARPLTGEERALAAALAGRPHFAHTPTWLGRRAATLIADGGAAGAARGWGWKEPNTALVADRLLGLAPDLRYLHLLRHPFDMALSRNQNQLANWGPALLGPQADLTPRAAVAFWCEAHRRFRAVERGYPGRVLALDYDAMCADPAGAARRIAALAGRELTAERIAWFARKVRGRGPVAPRRAALGVAQLDPADVAYVAAQGYAV